MRNNQQGHGRAPGGLPASLERDLPALTAGLTLPWSSGVVAGRRSRRAAENHRAAEKKDVSICG